MVSGNRIKQTILLKQGIKQEIAKKKSVKILEIKLKKLMSASMEKHSELPVRAKMIFNWQLKLLAS
jgi:uncharacterized protein YajQ (UPF0234 family)